MRHSSPHPLYRKIAIAFLTGTVLLTSCGIIPPKQKQNSSASAHPDVLASFFVEIPEPLPEGAQLSIDWVDRLNGHQLSPNYQPMDKVDDRHYQLDIPSKKGSLIQYRYVQTGSGNMLETGPDGKILASRFFYITEHSRIQDIVLGFTLGEKAVSTGRLTGTLQLKGTGQATVDALITAGGVTTTAGIDGKYLLEGVPAGVQNVTIFSPDGGFEPFEQQALVEANNVTPMSVVLTPRNLVNVTFIVKLPANTPPEAPIRLFGDISSLGDSFTGLYGGTSLIQDRGVTLTRQSGQEYLAVLQLPADLELHYLYSMGDTFWNSEVNPAGQPVRHTLFIDRQDMTIEDKVESWTTPNYNPVTFKFIPPAGTPSIDHIQIQFNTFGWMEPMEMWPAGDGSYTFCLSNPLNFSAPVNYRFCRSEMCGTLDPSSGQDQEFSFEANGSAQTLQSTAIQWTSWAPLSDPTIVTTETTTPKDAGYRAAVELTNTYRPAWLSYASNGLDAVTGTNANSVIIPVTWTYRSANPVWLAPDLSLDPSISDIRHFTSIAQEKGLRVYLMAQTRFQTSQEDFWNEFHQTHGDWDRWFEQLDVFYNSTALLASNIKADGLILGDEAISRVAGGALPVQEALNTYPEDGLQRWENVLNDVKTAYSGESWMALNYEDTQTGNQLPLNQVDGVYLLNLGPVSENAGGVKSYTESIAGILDNALKPFFTNSGKKAWIGLDFPSVDTAFKGCAQVGGNCRTPSILDFPLPSQPDLAISLQEQSNLYNAAIPEINRRDWIEGVSVRRFNVTGNRQDQSSSVRGKPASDVVWYWFASMTGKPIQ
jgi:hypothetical protein